MNPKNYTLAVTMVVNICIGVAQSTPDLILINGKIFTSAETKEFKSALAITGERISAVGTNEDIRGLTGPETRIIDLKGQVVVPGFNDAHLHFMPDREGIALKFSSMEPSWEETEKSIQSAIHNSPEGTWIFGDVGSKIILDTSVTRFRLDRIAPDHPVLLRAYYGHGFIMNSKAMLLFKIDENEPDPMGGFFERVFGSDIINGRFGEYAQWTPSRLLASQVSDDKAIEELKKLGNDAVTFGISSIQMMSWLPVDRLTRLLVSADLPIRVRVIPFATTSVYARDMTEIQALSKMSFSNKVTANGIKWIIDGTPFERGAALRESYSDMPGQTGKLNFSEEEITKMVKESLEYDQQLLLHCVGDRAVEAVLDAMETIGAGNIDWPSKRVRIEHGEGVYGDLAQRAQRLGVLVVQNPSHFALVEMLYSRWSPNMKFSGQKSIIDAGIPYALGSDGLFNPGLNIMLATIHPARPDEAITREQAVTAYTYGSAFAEFKEAEKGSLVIGKLADLAVLSQDIFTVPAGALPGTVSVLTIIGGKVVHDNLNFRQK